VNINFFHILIKENKITMELIKDLKKLIAELIPQMDPRINFMSYWKTNFLEKKETNTSSDAKSDVSCIDKCSINIVVLFGFI